MEDKTTESNAYGVVEFPEKQEGSSSPSGEITENRDDVEMAYYGKKQQLKASPWLPALSCTTRQRSMSGWMMVQYLDG